jgi:hypothetical protein
MTNDASLMQIGKCNGLHELATSRAQYFSILRKLLSAIEGRSAREPSQLAFDEDRSIVHQDRQSHSLSVGGARSLGS